MTRQVVPMTCDLLSALPVNARRCAYWELDAVSRAERTRADQHAAAKLAWLSHTLLEWGCCGQVLIVDGRPAGYFTYAPPAFVPSADSVPTAPISVDAVFLTGGQVLPDYRGHGYGRLLAQAVVKDVAHRKIRAVEAFAAHRSRQCVGDPAEPCLLPSQFLSAVGFRTARPHRNVPRMRLDIRSVATLRADVETAVDRLFAGLRPGALAN